RAIAARPRGAGRRGPRGVAVLHLAADHAAAGARVDAHAVLVDVAGLAPAALAAAVALDAEAVLAAVEGGRHVGHAGRLGQAALAHAGDAAAPERAPAEALDAALGHAGRVAARRLLAALVLAAGAGGEEIVAGDGGAAEIGVAHETAGARAVLARAALDVGGARLAERAVAERAGAARAGVARAAHGAVLARVADADVELAHQALVAPRAAGAAVLALGAGLAAVALAPQAGRAGPVAAAGAVLGADAAVDAP